MEFVKDKEMYLMVKDTAFNRKYHNYKINDICDYSKKHNEKYANLKKMRRKLFKTPKEKRSVFMEKLHEKVRKSINPELPSRLSSIILYDNIDDCYSLASKWKKNADIIPLGLFKVKCNGKLHACATTPDEMKSNKLIKEAHIDGITRFWKGDDTAKTHEYFFQGLAQIVEVINLDNLIENKNIVYHGSSVPGLTKLEPFKCKHDKAYVYATKDYLVVLHFAAKGQGMFDGWVKDDKGGIPTFYEARPNSFKERYYGKSSYCYHLPAKTFTDATGDPCEVVSETAVDVITCEEIKDIGKEYENLITEGKFKVVPYNTSKFNTKNKCDKYVLDQLIKRGYFEGKEFRQKKWAEEYYKDLIEDYKSKKFKN